MNVSIVYSSIVGTLTKTQVRYGFENTDILNIFGQFFHCVLFEELSLFRYFHHEFPVIRSKAFNWTLENKTLIFQNDPQRYEKLVSYNCILM
jgi:hypothetical protein